MKSNFAVENTNSQVAASLLLVLCFFFDMALAGYLGGLCYIQFIEVLSIEQNLAVGSLFVLALPLLWCSGYLKSPRSLATMMEWSLSLVMAFAYAGFCVLILKQFTDIGVGTSLMTRMLLAGLIATGVRRLMHTSRFQRASKIKIPSFTFFDHYQEVGLIKHKKFTILIFAAFCLALLTFEALYPASEKRMWIEPLLIWSFGFAAHIALILKRGHST